MRATLLVILGALSCAGIIGAVGCVGDAPVTVGGNDGSTNDAGTDALGDAAPVDAGLLLPNVAQGHLNLWLTADRGVTCTGGAQRITTWADQSSHHRDATAGNHAGPRCNAAGHTYASVDLPFFDAPAPPANAPQPVAEGTLDVDLGFLAGKDYTIFVVERRWGDRASNEGSTLLGTDVPLFPNACPGEKNRVLGFGYVYYSGFPELQNEQNCLNGTKGGVPDASAPPPSPLVYDMTSLSQSADDGGGLRQVSQNGTLLGPGIPSGTLSGIVGGSIGRWLSPLAANGDMRFLGDIAEVVIFDATLSTNEQQQMTAYLKTHWGL